MGKSAAATLRQRLRLAKDAANKYPKSFDGVHELRMMNDKMEAATLMNVNDLSHLPTVRFNAAVYEDVGRFIEAWELLFRARAVLRVRGHVRLGGGRSSLVDGKVIWRMRTYLTVQTPDETVIVPLKRVNHLRALTFTVGPA